MNAYIDRYGFVGVGGVQFPSASQLASRLSISTETFHRATKIDIVKGLGAEARSIGARNPDIGINELGNIVLKNPQTGKTIITTVPLESFGPK